MMENFENAIFLQKRENVSLDNYDSGMARSRGNSW